MGSYVASLDVGTTTIRCYIINQEAKIVGSATCKVKLLYPKPGYVEIDPNDLWQDVITVMKNAIQDAQLVPKDIKCLGISTQRSTFINWRKDTGEPFHNFITWKDLRANELIDSINSDIFMKVFRTLAYSLYIFTRNNRYLAGSRLKLACNHVTGRLLWTLSNIPELKEALQKDNVQFGTVETWLLHKLSGGRTYVTDISNASATAFYDPFVLDWGSWAIHLLKIPLKILPPVVENDYDFGEIDPDLLGASIPIKCVMSDQSSSMFGLGCLNKSDLKVTLGTGGFMNLNSWNTVHTTVYGMFPLVGWKINDTVCYLTEVPCSDVGSLMQWALNSGLLDDPSESDQIAQNIKSTDGVYFIPAFSGLGAPIFDEKAASGFVGIKPTTRKEHLLRAVLESIVFRIALSFFMLKKEVPDDYKKARVDGGVSQNDFICQMLADITELQIERPVSTEMSALGVCFLAGLKAGIWEDRSQVDRLCKIQDVFNPTTNTNYKQELHEKLEEWLKAAKRLKSWYCDK